MNFTSSLKATLAELRQDLVLFGEAAFGVLREEEAPVGENVELSLRARDRGGRDAELLRDLSRETRGPCVVTVSGRAVVDLDAQRFNTTRGCPEGAAAARSVEGVEGERDGLVDRQRPALLRRLGKGSFVELRADGGERLFVPPHDPGNAGADLLA